ARQVTHLVRLVDDLLDVSRVARGKIQLQKMPLDLAAVVRQAVETSRPLLDARHHHLTTVLPPEPVRVEGDFVRLAQAVANLLNNAAKYTDDRGEISVTVERADRGSETPGEALVRVRDNGRGIDPSALSSLFDLFYQVDRNLDRSEGGLGIGLALVRSLAEMHGGTVEARSEGRGHGSEFTVHLPLLREIPPRAPPAGRPARAPTLPAAGVWLGEDNGDGAESVALPQKRGGNGVGPV